MAQSPRPFHFFNILQRRRNSATVIWPGAEACWGLKGAKVRKPPRKTMATRDHFPKGPIQKAMICLPAARARGMRARRRRLSAGAAAWVTSFRISASSASMAVNISSNWASSGVPEKSCQERMRRVFPRRVKSSRRQAASVANSTSRACTP